MKRIYSPLQELDDEEIKRILMEGKVEDLLILPLSVGEYHADWKTAQDICSRLSNHADERVRANAALGFAYIACIKRKLEKHIVKPILLKLLNDCDEYKWRIIDSIKDINMFMKWHIGEKAINRLDESCKSIHKLSIFDSMIKKAQFRNNKYERQ